MTEAHLDVKTSNPEWLHFQITERCPLDCAMCYVQENGSTPAVELKCDELKAHVLPLCREYGIHRAVITGGEPFLRRDLIDLLQLFSDSGFDEFYFGSTLLGATEATVRRMLEIPGTWNFQASVDSIRRETLIADSRVRHMAAAGGDFGMDATTFAATRARYSVQLCAQPFKRCRNPGNDELP